jgi:hypothetical protein
MIGDAPIRLLRSMWRRVIGDGYWHRTLWPGVLLLPPQMDAACLLAEVAEVAARVRAVLAERGLETA